MQAVVPQDAGSTPGRTPVCAKRLQAAQQRSDVLQGVVHDAHGARRWHLSGPTGPALQWVHDRACSHLALLLASDQLLL